MSSKDTKAPPPEDVVAAMDAHWAEVFRRARIARERGEDTFTGPDGETWTLHGPMGMPAKLVTVSA